MKELFEFVRMQTGRAKFHIIGRSRRKEDLFARILFCYIAKNTYGYSSVRVAKELKRDHSSILNLTRKSENIEIIKVIAEKFDPKIKPQDTLREKLRGISFPKIYQEMYDIYGGRCAVCDFSAVVEICHIIPRYIGGEETRDNLIVLCPNHHGMFDRGLIKIEDIHIKIGNPQD